MHIQRYRVSFWIYDDHLEKPYYERKETVSSSGVGALHGLMRQAGLSLVHRAKVVTLRGGSCEWFENVSLPFKKVLV